MIRKQILIVDPNPSTLDFLREKLDAANVHIRTVRSGEEALDHLSRTPCDLMITALEMPPPNGMRLLVELQSRGLKVPIIFLSKLFAGESDARARLAELGPYVLLDKPIHMNRLYAAIEAALQMKIHWSELRDAPRLPIHLELNLTIQGHHDTRIPVRAETVDLSMSGVCFERTMCEVCTGYERGGVHADCVLFRYADRNLRGAPVEMTIHVGEHETLRLRGRVVHTLIEEGTPREFIGVRFTELSDRQREKLRDLLKREGAEAQA